MVQEHDVIMIVTFADNFEDNNLNEDRTIWGLLTHLAGWWSCWTEDDYITNLLEYE